MRGGDLKMMGKQEVKAPNYRLLWPWVWIFQSKRGNWDAHRTRGSLSRPEGWTSGFCATWSRDTGRSVSVFGPGSWVRWTEGKQSLQELTAGNFPGGLVVKTLTPMQGAQVWSLVRETQSLMLCDTTKSFLKMKLNCFVSSRKKVLKFLF